MWLLNKSAGHKVDVGLPQKDYLVTDEVQLGKKYQIIAAELNCSSRKKHSPNPHHGAGELVLIQYNQYLSKHRDCDYNIGLVVRILLTTGIPVLV